MIKKVKISNIFVIILALLIIAVIVSGAANTDTSSLKSLLKNSEFLYSLAFSFKTSFMATLLSLIFGVPAGLYLSRTETKTSYFLDALFDIPVVVPPLIVGVLLLTFFKLNFISSVFPLIFTWQGAVIAQFFVAFPLTVKSSKNSFELIPDSYEKIAMTLGSKPIKAFTDTTLKIAMPGIASGLILTWLRCMGEFGATLMVGGAIPFKTENVPINIYINMTSGNYSFGIAASVASIIFAFIFVVSVKIFLTSRFYKRNQNN